MERRSAEYFLAVVEHGSMTAAAAALYVSQPTLSIAMRRLEARLGVDLFHRSTRALTLTEAGRSLVEPARRILADIDRARRTVQDVVSLQRGELVVSAVPEHAPHPLPAIVARLRERLPDVRVVLRSGTAESVENDLREGRCEVAITDGLLRGGEEVCQHRGPDQEVVLVSPLDVTLPDPLPRARLSEIPLVLEVADHWLRAELGEHLTSVVVDCAHRQAIRTLVSEGAGSAPMARGTAAVVMSGHVPVRLDPPAWRPFILAHRAGPPSPAARAVIEAAGLPAQCPGARRQPLGAGAGSTGVAGSAKVRARSRNAAPALDSLRGS
ncbi:LysR family transcriptional regulator [Pseudonocardia sp. RS11V-5]|uniref:LysR family transcriptional regulator n=1 Tax=Pseudonocardia terrae TaxID=2905831 RepID=UPI001E615642|nr:LysR family transcriptional regulator [Pseudonocardia terrae]MCE3554725.1 LysR family transcriptional regulator [Pseudonocardia terrae]